MRENPKVVVLAFSWYTKHIFTLIKQIFQDFCSRLNVVLGGVHSFSTHHIMAVKSITRCSLASPRGLEDPSCVFMPARGYFNIEVTFSKDDPTRHEAHLGVETPDAELMSNRWNFRWRETEFYYSECVY